MADKPGTGRGRQEGKEGDTRHACVPLFVFAASFLTLILSHLFADAAAAAVFFAEKVSSSSSAFFSGVRLSFSLSEASKGCEDEESESKKSGERHRKEDQEQR